jgi:hypothetical protein
MYIISVKNDSWCHCFSPNENSSPFLSLLKAEIRGKPERLIYKTDTKIQLQLVLQYVGEYSQNFIFCVTYEWAQ